MAQKTIIAWTDATWNPVHGCSVVSPGCAHCYAAELSLRYGWTKKSWTPANAAENVMLKPHKLYEPLTKRKPFDRPCMVFVNSMSDLFHEQIPFEYIDRIFAVMALAQHTFQALTKRPERMREYFEYNPTGKPCDGTHERVAREAQAIGRDRVVVEPQLEWPLRNVWLGVSIENRRFVSRADVLRRVPAAIRWISAEPLLGPLFYDREGSWADGVELPELDLMGLQWVVVGGESGKGYRPMELQWARDIWDRCKSAGIPYFFKQNAAPRTEMGIDALGEIVREYPIL